jgi:hypothetical protein
VGDDRQTTIGLIGVAVGIRVRSGPDLVPLMVGLSAAMIAFAEVCCDFIGAVYFPFTAYSMLCALG